MLSGIVTVVAIVAFVVGVTWAQYRWTNGRMWSAQWLAFSFTAFGALFLVTGAIGYRLGKHARFLAPNAWQDGVVWLQVGLGAVMLAVAAMCWVIALRSYNVTPVPRT